MTIPKLSFEDGHPPLAEFCQQEITLFLQSASLLFLLGFPLERPGSNRIHFCRWRLIPHCLVAKYGRGLLVEDLEGSERRRLQTIIARTTPPLGCDPKQQATPLQPPIKHPNKKTPLWAGGIDWFPLQKNYSNVDYV